MAAAQQDASVAIVRTIKSTPRALWRALTEPALLAQWLDAATVDADVRSGGRYRLVTNSPDGEVRGEYLEIVPGGRLVCTWSPAAAPHRESRLTVELTPAGDGTELLLRHENIADVRDRKRLERMWNASIRRLVRILV